MAFTYSISNGDAVITQTGTDTNLSGLSGLTGVIVSGIQYTLDNTRLVVDGTLTAPRSTNRLRFANYVDRSANFMAVFINNGTFDNSETISFAGVVINDPLPSISFDFEKVSNTNNGSFDLHIKSNAGSNTTIEGMVTTNDTSTAGTAGHLAHQFEGTTTLNHATFVNSSIGKGKLIFVSQSSSSLTLNKCEFYGHGLRVGANTLVVNGLKVFGHGETINVNTGNFVSDLALEGMEGFGVNTVFRSAAVSANLKFIRYINMFSSLTAPIPNQGITLSSAVGSKTLVQNRMIFNVLDSSGAVQNAKIHSTDVDNGNRSSTEYGAGQPYEIAVSSSLTYAATTDSSGNATLLVTSAVWYLDSGTSNAHRQIDNRGVGNTYDLNYKIASFGHLPANQTPLHYSSGDKKPVALLSNDTILTELNQSTILAYSEIETAIKFYDRAKKYWYDFFSGETSLIVTRIGSLIDAGASNVTIDATASSAFSISGNTITIKASTFTGDMTTTGVITLVNGALFNGTRTDANGTVLPLRNISVTGLTAGSRLRVYNETTSAQIVNAIVSGTSYTATYAEGTGYSANNVLSLRVTKIDKLEAVSSVVVSATGWTALISQDPNTVYAAHAVNGATVTGITWDSGNMQFDFNETDNVINGPDVGAWYQYFITTEVGIAEAFGALIWPQINRLTNVTSKAAITWDNTKSTPLQINNVWVDRDDGASIIATTSNSIQINPPAVFVTTSGGVAGLTPEQAAELTAVKTKTDLLNFTGTDVKATLDGEAVVTDTASRNASKADLDSVTAELGTIDTSLQQRSVPIIQRGSKRNYGQSGF